MNIVHRFPTSDYGPWTRTVVLWLKDTIGPCLENIEGGHLVLSDAEFDDKFYQLFGVLLNDVSYVRPHAIVRNGAFRPKIFRGDGWSMGRIITKTPGGPPNNKLPPGVLPSYVQCWFYFAFDDDAQAVQFKLTNL